MKRKELTIKDINDDLRLKKPFGLLYYRYLYTYYYIYYTSIWFSKSVLTLDLLHPYIHGLNHVLDQYKYQ